MTVEGQPTKTVPEKGDYIVNVTCDNEASGSWDYDNWTITIGNLKTTKIKCSIDFRGDYKETLLAGADPVLGEGMVPVKIASDGTVTKANKKEEWYSYEKKNWANAVITISGKNYNTGETIPETDIESYFVWIPKYSYQLWNIEEYNYTSISEMPTSPDSNAEHAILIKFGVENTSNAKDGECTTLGVSGEIGKCEKGDYMTHPAFLAFNTTGLWVGKFETGYKDATSASEVQINETNASKVVIKPNVYSWRGINVSNMFYTSKGYKENLQSHMMKNTEWGAVAYLTNSEYGRCTSGTCTDVEINSYNGYVTGYANADTTYPSSVLASTTGNISGIYDLSGGIWDSVMSVILNTNGTPIYGNSGFTDEIFPSDSRYYDAYKDTTSPYNYTGRILGDATAELGPFYSNSISYSNGRVWSSWYGKEGRMSLDTAPWFARGGDRTLSGVPGLFGFAMSDGYISGAKGFRIVIAAF